MSMRVFASSVLVILGLACGKNTPHPHSEDTSRTSIKSNTEKANKESLIKARDNNSSVAKANESSVSEVSLEEIDMNASTLKLSEMASKTNFFDFGHMRSVSSVKWSPDGTKIASGSDDKNIKIWDKHNIYYIYMWLQHNNITYTLRLFK